MQLSVTNSAYTEEERHSIEAQLERLLANPFFSHSRRFPSFLRYVIGQTLSGHAEDLKERTLGIEIFGKTADYDTATDPIVRVTAAEIRKRIAQYYQDPGHEHELRISLPPGSYIPVFHLQSFASSPEQAPAETSPFLHAPASETPIKRLSQWHYVPWIVSVLLLAGATGVFLWQHAKRSAFADFWGPFLASSEPVLFCVADQTQYTAISLRDASDPSRQVTLKDNLTAVIIDDLSTITKVAGVMQSANKKYSLRGESSTSLADLRNGPSVVVGAFDNAWTLRLLRPLRFYFANNPEMTQFSIVDATTPNQVKWIVDRSQQIATNNYRDYAIVARFTDSNTGKPTLVIAGIGRGGTASAGDFVTDPSSLQIILNRRPTPDAKNFEVVLSTQIIDGEPGTARVEALYYW
jgi:hypothetical protein